MSDERGYEGSITVHPQTGENSSESLSAAVTQQIYAAVSYAMRVAREEEQAEQAKHRCLFAITKEDKDLINSMMHVMKEIPPKDIRENHEWVMKMRKISERIGNIVIAVVFAAITGGIITAVITYARSGGSGQ